MSDKDKSLAYQLGYSSGKSKRGEINFRKKIFTPTNSFSNPKKQSVEFRRGVKAGKRSKK